MRAVIRSIGIFLGACLLVCPGQAAVALEGVVVSIPPLHSLVSSIMKGTDEPRLLLRSGGSPHSYALRPSDAAALQKARLVFLVSHELESFLEGPLKNLSGKARIVEIVETEGLTLHDIREGGAFEGHNHAHGKHHHTDAHEEHDPHVWLDPENAKIITERIAEALIDTDPANTALYTRNAAHTKARLDALIAEIKTQLTPHKQTPFIVFHDAYQYFEKRFGLAVAGAITLSPERQPGAARVVQIRKLISKNRAVCIFTEPQFEPRLVAQITQDTDARSGVLDPLGAALQPGPDLYFAMMRDNAQAMRNCFQGAS